AAVLVRAQRGLAARCATRRAPGRRVRHRCPRHAGVRLAARAVRCHRGWRRAMRWLTTRAPSGRLRRSLYALLVLLQWTVAFGAVAITLHAVLDWHHV